MDDDLLKKMARTFLAHYGEVYISKSLAADIALLAKRIRQGDEVTAAEVDVVLAELDGVPGFKEALSMKLLEDCIAPRGRMS